MTDYKRVPCEVEKQRARRKVRDALVSGLLVRPTRCERCGAAPEKASDGRATIHAHHHDYSQPLNVEWLCPKCHRAETPLPEKIGAPPPPGELHWNAKLTADDVRAIRGSTLGCRRLARAYGVDKKTIQRARNGQQWTSVN